MRLAGCPNLVILRFVFLTLISLLVSNSLINSIRPPAWAGPSYWHRSTYPSGTVSGLDNWGAKDAAGYCFRSRGRSFTVNHNYSFPLSGISVLVMVDGRNEAGFDAAKLRLSLFKVEGDNSSTIAANLPPSTSPLIAREGDGSPTFDVYFSWPDPAVFFDGAGRYKVVLECLTEEQNLYRVWEADNLKTGEALFYNSETGSETAYIKPGRKILFSLFRPANSSVYPALVANPSTLAAKLTPPKFHPVVLIHGLGGRPENWRDEAKGMNYQKMLTDLGYPQDYLHLYNYGFKDGQYNYQGDIREIAANLEAVVGQLSQLHRSQGGDGRVDLVGHSLGSLVARYYLNTHKDNHQVRKFIAVGAPFKGSWIMDLDQGIKEIPGVGGRIERTLARAFSFYVKRAGLISTISPLAPSSLAAQQVRSDSQFLSELNESSRAPRDVRIYSLYGDVNLALEQQIFKSTVRRKISVGDGVVLPESAAHLPGTSPNLIAFEESEVATGKLMRNADASFSVEFPKLESINLFHNFMLSHSSVRDKIKEILISE